MQDSSLYNPWITLRGGSAFKNLQGIPLLRPPKGRVNIQEWWVTLNRNDGSTWSGIYTVISYIANQHQHHSKKTFPDEYLAFLKKYNVDYDERYVWD